MGKSTISMVIFNSYVKLPEGIYIFLETNFQQNPSEQVQQVLHSQTFWCNFGARPTQFVDVISHVVC